MVDARTLPPVVARMLASLSFEPDLRVLGEETLREVTRVLEDIVLAHDLPGALFAGFQRTPNWLPARARYQQLAAAPDRTVAVYATGVFDEAEDDVTRVGMAPDDPLVGVWFLLFLTSHMSVVMLAADLELGADEEQDRRFLTLLSYSPEVVEPIVREMRDELDRLDPRVAARIDAALEAHPPTLDGWELRDGIVGRVVEALERGRRRIAAVAEAEHEAAEQMRRLDAAKNAFLSAVSHELRTPLTVAHGLAATLDVRGEELDGATREHVSAVLHEHTERLRQLLDDLLDVDRLVRGTLVAEPRDTDLGAELEAAVAELAEADGVDRVALDVPERVRAAVDPVQFRRIVANLTENATKYAPEGEVRVRLAREDGHVVLSVEDDGPGIAPDDREAVFEPFHRLDADHPQPGTGIGLALVAEFARLHDGRSWVEEGEGGGTRVVVTFPVDGQHGDTG